MVTKANRAPLLECEVLTIPTGSISFGHNAVDDHRIGRIAANVAIRARGPDGAILSGYPAQALTRAIVMGDVAEMAIQSPRRGIPDSCPACFATPSSFAFVSIFHGGPVRPLAGTTGPRAVSIAATTH